MHVAWLGSGSSRFSYSTDWVAQSRTLTPTATATFANVGHDRLQTTAIHTHAPAFGQQQPTESTTQLNSQREGWLPRQSDHRPTSRSGSIPGRIVIITPKLAARRDRRGHRWSSSLSPRSHLRLSILSSPPAGTSKVRVPPLSWLKPPPPRAAPGRETTLFVFSYWPNLPVGSPMPTNKQSRWAFSGYN